MKKINLISKSAMKKVMGGGGCCIPCVAYAICSVEFEPDTVPLPTECCGTLEQAGDICHNLGYYGPYTCFGV